MSIQKSSKGRYNEINCTGPLPYSHRLLAILKYRTQKYEKHKITKSKNYYTLLDSVVL